MTDVLQTLWEVWVADSGSRGVFVHVLQHDCKLSQCVLRTIPLWYCEENVCMGPSPPTMGWVQGTAAFFERGGNPMCTKADHGGLVPATDLAIHFCTVTGKPHFCGTLCKNSTLNSDGATVCTLTGQVVEERRVTTGMFGDPDPLVGYVPKDTKELTSVTLQEKALDFVGARKHIPQMERNYSSYWAHSILHITAILSPQRFNEENRQAMDQRSTLHEVLLRSMNNRKKKCDFLELLLLAAQFRERASSAVQIHMTPAHTKVLVPHYAAIFLGLWGILRSVVPHGREIAKRSCFKDCIIATLEMYRTGITVRDRLDLYDIELLPMDPVLATVGISEHAKKIVLANRASNKNITRLRKTITTLLQDAVTTHGISPECLRIGEAAKTLRELPDYVFE